MHTTLNNNEKHTKYPTNIKTCKIIKHITIFFSPLHSKLFTSLLNTLYTIPIRFFLFYNKYLHTKLHSNEKQQPQTLKSPQKKNTDHPVPNLGTPVLGERPRRDLLTADDPAAAAAATAQSAP